MGRSKTKKTKLCSKSIFFQIVTFQIPRMSNPKETKTMEPSSKSTSSSLRPTGSILAPSKLSFGAGTKSENHSSTTLAPSKLSFPGFKASKLASIVPDRKAEEDCDSNNKLSTPALQKPSFIPLATEAKIETTEPVSVTSSSSSPPDTTPSALALKEVASAKADSEPKENSSQFVFGQNLTDRAANFTQIKNGSNEAKSKEEGGGEKQKEEDQDSTIPSSDKEKTKTLSESAAEYCETRNRKVEYNEVELITGEEDESNVFQMSAKLHIFEKNTSSWLERGRGPLRLNDKRLLSSEDKSSTCKSSRIIMRTAGSLRVILNSKVFPEMTLEKPNEKNIRLTAMDGMDQSMRVFLVGGSPKDIGTLFVALTRRLDSLRSTNGSSSPTTHPAKRKLAEESIKADDTDDQPPPEKGLKQM